MVKQSFLSDNASPAHPLVLQALVDASRDHVTSYGDDRETAVAVQAIQEALNCQCGVYFVYNGTGANVSALRSLLRPWQAVICTEMAHINEDEGGAPEALGGFKLLPVHREDGMLRPEDLAHFRSRRGFVHTSQPAVVSLTQSSEVGRVYQPDQLQAICDAAHHEGYLVHMDGARIANAAAALAGTGTPVEALRRACAGVDILSFGATKNGLLFGEAVVFLRRGGIPLPAEEEYPYFRKQTAQLHSKMRYVAVQFSRYLQDDLWFHGAVHANGMARRLADGLAPLPGVTLQQPCDANGVFVQLPPEVLPVLQEEFGFYPWQEERSVARLMASWDTTPELVDSFVKRCAALCR